MSYLEHILRHGAVDDFPEGKKDAYIRQFENVKSDLEGIQSNVATGALLAEIRQKIKDGEDVDPEQLIYLNNHGPAHISCVIDRCSQLLKKNEHQLTGYESYILLIAIHLHDLGNIGGRIDHEKRVFEHIENLGENLGRDSAEKKIIGRIAAVHGGAINGNKDTIKHLQPDDQILGIEFNSRLLASLLRFSDELADDRTRAARYELETGILPEQSKIYHKFSECLSSVIINKGSIRLKFNLDAETASTLYAFNGGKKYLIDEIYSRLLKMHRERIYCMRFLRPKFDISKIDFKIEVDHPIDPLGKTMVITDCLEDSGFPDSPVGGIADLCPSLREKTGGSIHTTINSLQESAIIP